MKIKQPRKKSAFYINGCCVLCICKKTFPQYITAKHIKRRFSMIKTKAVIFEAKDVIRTGEVTLPECGPDQLIAETLYSFVSPGTELRVLAGHYGSEGKYPLVPGYAAVSRVLECGSAVKGFRKGDLISCRNAVHFADCCSRWGGQAGMHVYETDTENTPVLLPEGIDDPLPYSVVEVASISLRGVEAADPKFGETALVVGQGMIGQFSSMFLKMSGCRVTVCDIDENRLAEARKNGCAAAVDLTQSDAEDRLCRLGNGGYDIVVEASGSIPGFELACKLIRRKPQNYSKDYKVEPIRFYGRNWARLVLQANYIRKAEVEPFNFFPGEGVTVLAPFDRGIEERQRVIEYIRSGKIDPSFFVQTVCRPDDMPSYYRKLQKKEILSLVCDWR